MGSDGNMLDDVGGGEADLGEAGVFVGFTAVPGGAADGGGEAFFGETENLVVLGGDEAFHGAGIDLEEGGGGHEIAEGDVGLADSPFCGDLAAGAVDDFTDHHAAKGLERFEGTAAHLDGTGEEFIDIGLGDFQETGENDVVGAIGYLRLVPGVGPEPGLGFRAGDDDEFPRLKTAGRRGQDERFLKGVPNFE